jgi:hypothetical protein
MLNRGYRRIIQHPVTVLLSLDRLLGMPGCQYPSRTTFGDGLRNQ